MTEPLTLSVTTWEPHSFVEITTADIAQVVRSIQSSDLAWIDVRPESAELEAAFRDLIEQAPSLAGLDPVKATRQEKDPAKRPPKTKAFQDFVFARAYWLHVADDQKKPSLIAQQIHIFAGPTFVITIRYPCLAWDMDKLGSGSGEQPAPSEHEGIRVEKLRDSIDEFRRRVPAGVPQLVFGLEVACVVLDKVIDSVFVALDGLRELVDAQEQKILAKEWVWDRAEGQLIDEQLSGFRRLLRRVRWAFLPSDEVDELGSGPFLEVPGSDRGIKFRLEDLAREADRAVKSVDDILAQIQEVVDLRDGIKNDKLTDTTYALTVVATVLLVPALLAGIYGMNVATPFASGRQSFWVMVGLMALLGPGVWLGTRWLLHRQSKGPDH